MKQLNKKNTPLFIALGTTLFLHYFFLTNFNVASIDGFVGEVKQIKETSTGLFPNAEISFEVSEFLHGNWIKEKRVVHVVRNRPIKFKIGKIYTVKTHKDWLCSYSRS